MDSHFLELRNLGSGIAFSAFYDCTGMAHPFIRRRRDAGNIGNKWHIGVLGTFCLKVSPNLTDENDCLSYWILCEPFQYITECLADDRITTDTDHGTLADPCPRELIDNFVGKCPTS